MYTSPLRHTIQPVSVLLSSLLLIVCNHCFIQNVPVDIVTALLIERLRFPYRTPYFRRVVHKQCCIYQVGATTEKRPMVIRGNRLFSRYTQCPVITARPG